MTPTRIIWHHTADSQQAHQFDKVNEYHRSRGFPRSSLGFYVGYHWFIERDGAMRQARKDDEIGAHDQGENLNSLGIALAGNFNAQLPTEAQAEAAAVLLGTLLRKHNIKIYRVEPHRWDDTTDCPGTMLKDNWLIKQYLTREKSLYHRLFWWMGERIGLL